MRQVTGPRCGPARSSPRSSAGRPGRPARRGALALACRACHATSGSPATSSQPPSSRALGPSRPVLLEHLDLNERDGRAGHGLRRSPSIAGFRAVTQPPSLLTRPGAEHWAGRALHASLLPYFTRALAATSVTPNAVTLMIPTGLLAALAVSLPSLSLPPSRFPRPVPASPRLCRRRAGAAAPPVLPAGLYIDHLAHGVTGGRPARGPRHPRGRRVGLAQGLDAGRPRHLSARPPSEVGDPPRRGHPRPARTAGDGGRSTCTRPLAPAPGLAARSFLRPFPGSKPRTRVCGCRRRFPHGRLARKPRPPARPPRLRGRRGDQQRDLHPRLRSYAQGHAARGSD